MSCGRIIRAWHCLVLCLVILWPCPNVISFNVLVRSPAQNQNSEQFEIKERKRILNFKSGKTVKLNGDEFYTLADDGKTIRREFVRDVEIERCDRHLTRVPEWSDYPSWYVDPSTRGFNVTKLLSDFIGYDQYDVSLPPQPWRRPHCDKLEPDIEPVFVDSIKGIQFRDSYPANAQGIDFWFIYVFIDIFN